MQLSWSTHPEEIGLGPKRHNRKPTTYIDPKSCPREQGSPSVICSVFVPTSGSRLMTVSSHEHAFVIKLRARAAAPAGLSMQMSVKMKTKL